MECHAEQEKAEREKQTAVDPAAEAARRGALEILDPNMRGWGPPGPVYVRLKAPPGIGAVQTLSGRHITIGEDRIVEMSEEDAKCLIPSGWITLAEESLEETG